MKIKSAEEILKTLYEADVFENPKEVGIEILGQWQEEIREKQLKEDIKHLDEFRDKIIKGTKLLVAGKMDELEELCPGMKETSL